MMTHHEAVSRCDAFSEQGRTALETYELRIAEKELELIELENVRQTLCFALEKTGQLLAEAGEGLPSAERTALQERLESLPHEIVLAEQCVGLLRQVIDKTRALAELERHEASPYMTFTD
jgi:hypothetical protein